MSWKEDFIAKHGEEAYANRLTRRRRWGEKLPGGEAQRSKERREENPEKWRKYCRERSRANPERVKEKGREVSRKTGKYYKKKQLYKQTGIQCEREHIRMRHGYYWMPYKHIIAPGSHLHHEWVKGTSKYIGMALVEADRHMRCFIDVIEILEGGITLFTEKEVRKRE
jgi:hypothetical protein